MLAEQSGTLARLILPRGSTSFCLNSLMPDVQLIEYSFLIDVSFRKEMKMEKLYGILRKVIKFLSDFKLN